MVFDQLSCAIGRAVIHNEYVERHIEGENSINYFEDVLAFVVSWYNDKRARHSHENVEIRYIGCEIEDLWRECMPKI